MDRKINDWTQTYEIRLNRSLEKPFIIAKGWYNRLSWLSPMVQAKS